MVADNSLTVDELLLSGMSGSEKLKALLKKRGGTLADWARKRGIEPVEIHHTLARRREYPEHRQAIANDLGFTREYVDELIGDVVPAEPAAT